MSKTFQMGQIYKNEVFYGANIRESLFDLTIPEGHNGELIVFSHGFMGFKDWGAWHLVESYFVQRKFAFCRFNFSHNGGTIVQPIDFPDENAFSQNTYSFEVHDLMSILSHLSLSIQHFNGIHLIGHSRGGGISLLAAAKMKDDVQLFQKVNSVGLWASISDIFSRFPSGEELEKWENEGLRFVFNSRTNQRLPQSFNLYKDYLENSDLLNIQKACQNLNMPVFIAHGNLDTSVLIAEGENLSAWLQKPLHIIEGADHVFGAKHPWVSDKLPTQLKELCDKQYAFLLAQ
jgi:pimeloyl-ACP methyl ester carboxylesterase